MNNCYQFFFLIQENGKRSQLWRMTTSGLLEHEGSSAPRDPRKKAQVKCLTYVLDITDIAPQMGRYMSLTVRKPDERRKTNQTWVFTEVKLSLLSDWKNYPDN